MIAAGLLLLVVGGFAAGSFYIPFKKVKNWAWESYWLVNGVFSWIVMPWLIAYLTVPQLMSVLKESSGSVLFWTYLFGVLWGVGGLTFGLSMRYLGMSLGYAIALGFCAAFGTLIPPIYFGKFGGLLTSLSGQATLGGVVVCLVGIAVCARAGIMKEKELSAEQKKEAIEEFNFSKGLAVAICAGVMSACMAFAFSSGKQIAELAMQHGSASLWQNNPILIVALAGGFTTNFIWCVYLNIKNRTGKNYIDNSNASIAGNYVFSALAGTMWYMQFLFYGMGSTKMGNYAFSAWTIHMALIIIFSNMWGLIFKEWKGCSQKTLSVIATGILVVMLSIVFIGTGNYLASIGK